MSVSNFYNDLIISMGRVDAEHKIRKLMLTEITQEWPDSDYEVRIEFKPETDYVISLYLGDILLRRCSPFQGPKCECFFEEESHDFSGINWQGLTEALTQLTNPPELRVLKSRNALHSNGIMTFGDLKIREV